MVRCWQCHMVQPIRKERRDKLFNEVHEMYILTISVKLQNISWGTCFHTNKPHSKYFPFSIILCQFENGYFFMGEIHTVFTLFSVTWSCQKCLQYTFVFCVSTRESFHFPISSQKLSKGLGSAQGRPHSSLCFSSSLCSWQTQMPSFCFSTGQNPMQDFGTTTCWSISELRVFHF